MSCQPQTAEIERRPTLLSTCEAVCSFYVACMVSLLNEDVAAFQFPELKIKCSTWILQPTTPFGNNFTPAFYISIANRCILLSFEWIVWFTLRELSLSCQNFRKPNFKLAYISCRCVSEFIDCWIGVSVIQFPQYTWSSYIWQHNISRFYEVFLVHSSVLLWLLHRDGYRATDFASYELDWSYQKRAPGLRRIWRSLLVLPCYPWPGSVEDYIHGPTSQRVSLLSKFVVV